jgi:5'-3' exonuclease
MVEFEADDVIAAAAWKYAEDPDVGRILMCSPDKDMAQAVHGERIVMFDRIRNLIIDEVGVQKKWGIAPASIPDWLALVGDKADGIPGIARWGAKSASTVLARWGRADAIPEDPADWDVTVRGAKTLATNLNAERDAVVLYRTLATLRADVPIAESAHDLQVTGPDWDRLHALCTRIGDERFFDRRRRAQGHD